MDCGCTGRAVKSYVNNRKLALLTLLSGGSSSKRSDRAVSLSDVLEIPKLVRQPRGNHVHGGSGGTIETKTGK